MRRWIWIAMAVLLGGCPEPDIRTPDAGDETDAGSADAGARDAGFEDAGRDAAVRDAGDEIRTNVVFVTSEPVAPGELGGLAAADAVCNRLAMRAGLPEQGSYVAWLSTSSVEAVSRLVGSRGWMRPDGLPVADDPLDLVAGQILYPPSLDERGEPGATLVLTGTNPAGRVEGNCNDWTSDTGEVRFGTSTDGTRRWTSTSDRDCGIEGSIYCFGTGRDESIATAPRSARLVFLTDDPADGRVGIEGFDAHCQREADMAGFEGRTFVALVSTTEMAATERLTDGASWFRPDGVLVARTPSDFGAESLTAPVTCNADTSTYRDAYIWAGSLDPSERSGLGDDCDGWSPTGDRGVRGLSGKASDFFGEFPSECHQVHHLVCAEP